MIAADSSMYVITLVIQRNSRMVKPALQYTDPINVFFLPTDSVNTTRNNKTNLKVKLYTINSSGIWPTTYILASI